MGLGRNKLLLDGRYSTNGTYRSILTILILGAFRRIAITVGNNGEGFRSIIPDTGNDGVCVGGIMADCRNYWICVDCKRLLKV